jgi:hypothetical protein
MARTTMRLLPLSVIFAAAAALKTNGSFILNSQGDDRRPPTGRRGQDPVISDKVESGGRNQSGEFRQELERFEHEMRRAVAPAMPELIQEPAILLARWRVSAPPFARFRRGHASLPPPDRRASAPGRTPLGELHA